MWIVGSTVAEMPQWRLLGRTVGLMQTAKAFWHLKTYQYLTTLEAAPLANAVKHYILRSRFTLLH
jgi:hypothetical protein